MDNLEMEIITATKVADEDRLNFWLRYVGMAKMLAFERHVYCWMRRLCPHYDGGYWNFYDLSNGGFYIAPADEKKMWLTWPGNYFNDEMSGDAAGIVATLLRLTILPSRSALLLEKSIGSSMTTSSHILKPRRSTRP